MGLDSFETDSMYDDSLLSDSTGSTTIDLSRWRESIRSPQEQFYEEDESEEWIPSPYESKTMFPKVTTKRNPRDIYSVRIAPTKIGLHQAVVKRKNLANGLGIYFTKTDPDSPLRIKEIVDNGPFADSSLSPGMVVVSINETYMAWSSPEDAIEEILCSDENKVYLTAEESSKKVYRRSYTMNVRSNLTDWGSNAGIVFGRKDQDSPLYIKEVRKDGPFPSSTLLPGMLVLAVNGRFMAWKSPDAALQELKSLQSGYAVLTVESVVASVNMKIEPIGFDVRDSYGERCVCIDSLPPKSISRDTSDLRVGMQVLVLHNQICPLSLEELYSSLEVENKLRLVAVDANCKKTDYVHYLDMDDIDDDDEEARSQRDFVAFNDLSNQIVNQNFRIEESMSFAMKKCLVPSFEEHVNKNTIPYLDNKDRGFPISASIAKPTSTKTKKEAAPRKIFCIQKESANEDVGLKLTLGENNGIYISEIQNFSKFRYTGMQPGMRIVTINGLPCPTSMRVATALINAAEGNFEIMATFGKKQKQKTNHQIFFTAY